MSSGPQWDAQEAGRDTSLPKPSRYRSVRGKSESIARDAIKQALESDLNQFPVPGDNTNSSILRSMSRYRNRPKSVSTTSDAISKFAGPQAVDAPPPIPPVPPIPQVLKPADAEASQRSSKESFETSHRSSGRVESVGSSITRHSSNAPKEEPLRKSIHNRMATEDSFSRPSSGGGYNSDRPSTRSRAEVLEEDEARRKKEREDAARWAEEVSRLEGENEKILAEQKKKDLQRLQATLAANGAPSPRSPKQRSPIVEKFVFLTKGRRSNVPSPNSMTPGSLDFSHSPLSPTSPLSPPTKPPYIEVGGRGIVPQTDAPNSAANGGDRVVNVKCRHVQFDMVVSPDTTPVEVLMATAREMNSEFEINPSTCVLIEAYLQLGLARRVRRYEIVRDIMNSWDRDSQNTLMVEISDSAEQDEDLEIDFVPRSDDPPRGFKLYLYHSQRPGRWSKRHITLLDDGRMFLSKKPELNLNDKDCQALCNLTDYDLYNPTVTEMKKHLKPPKRFCYALKSQQKTTIFENTENYVHFFSTDDPQVAASFRESIHVWRSWYLLKHRVVLEKEKSRQKIDDKPPQIDFASKHAPKKSINVAAVDGHRLRVSVDEAPYAIGSLEPLLDMKRFDKRLSAFGKDFLPADSTEKQRITAIHEQKESGSSEDNKFLIDRIKSANDAAFTGNGLLGSVYEDRKHAHKDSQGNVVAKDGPFTEGPSLLNGIAEGGKDPASPKADPKPWFPSAAEHTAARNRTREAARPNTSAGIIHGRHPSITHQPPLPLVAPLNIRPKQPNSPPGQGRSQRPPLPHNSSSNASQGMSHSNRRERPRPLVNLSPTSTDLPHRPRGHGVKADPADGPLVTLSPTSTQIPAHRASRGHGVKMDPSNGPLVTLSPTIQEPPHRAGDRGHGVKADLPEGAYLVDLITMPHGAGSGHLEVPSRSGVRRDRETSQPIRSGTLLGSEASRMRSRSSGPGVGRRPGPLLGEAPPMPTMPVPPVPPISAARRERARKPSGELRQDNEDRQSRSHESRQKQRTASDEQFQQNHGRVGTLKAC